MGQTGRAEEEDVMECSIARAVIRSGNRGNWRIKPH
jgi:hypothetical protein